MTKMTDKMTKIMNKKYGQYDLNEQRNDQNDGKI